MAVTLERRSSPQNGDRKIQFLLAWLWPKEEISRDEIGSSSTSQTIGWFGFTNIRIYEPMSAVEMDL